jgi:hypothetical protein
LAAHLTTSVAHLHALHNAPWWDDYVESLCGEWTPGFSTVVTHGVLEALAEKAQKGDVAAIKLYLEMAGIYVPRGRGKVIEAGEDPRERLGGMGDDELERLERELGMGS